MNWCEVLTFEGDHFTGWIHDRAVGRDGSADGSVGVGHVNNNHLGLFAHLLSDANEFIRLHGQSAEPDVGWVDSKVLQLREAQKAIYQVSTSFSSFTGPCIEFKPTR